jgi:hypothetical protein
LVSEPVVGPSVNDVAAVDGVIMSAWERGIKHLLAQGCDV